MNKLVRTRKTTNPVTAKVIRQSSSVLKLVIIALKDQINNPVNGKKKIINFFFIFFSFRSNKGFIKFSMFRI